ncbi:MAG: hypothetical protein AB7I01_23065, partial [Gammaproteobacteria bacterium]
AAEPLLFTSAGHAQHYQEWLFEVLVALVDRVGGLPALRALELLLGAAVLQQVYRFGRHQGFTPSVALALVASLVLFAYQRLLQLRPELLAMLAFFALLNLYCVPRLGAARAAAVVALVVLWTNVHATVLIVFPFMLAWQLVHARRARAHIATLLAAFAAVALNPQGLRQYVFYFIHDANNPLARVVDEWGALFVAPKGYTGVLPWSAPLLLAAYVGVLLAVLVVALATLRGRSRAEPHRILWAALALAAAAVAVRFLWLMPLALAAVLPEASRPAARHGRVLALAALLLVTVHLFGGDTRGYGYPLRGDALAGWLAPRGLNTKLMPATVAAIEASGFGGRLLAPYELGGYLSYALHPRVRVYFNGRYDSYPRAVYDDYFAMLTGGAAAAARLRHHGVDAALLPADDVHYRLVYTLRRLGWCDAYQDTQAVWLLAPAAQGGRVACDARGTQMVDAVIAARLAAGDAFTALNLALHHQRYTRVLAMLADVGQAAQVRRAAASIAGMCRLNARLASGLPQPTTLDSAWAAEWRAESALCALPEMGGAGAG